MYIPISHAYKKFAKLKKIVYSKQQNICFIKLENAYRHLNIYLQISSFIKLTYCADNIGMFNSIYLHLAKDPKACIALRKI